MPMAIAPAPIHRAARAAGGARSWGGERPRVEGCCALGEVGGSDQEQEPASEAEAAVALPGDAGHAGMVGVTAGTVLAREV